MDYQFETHQLVNNSKLDELIKDGDKEVGLPVELGEDLTLISFIDKSKYNMLEIDLKHEFNVSVSIASATAAYARIHMTQFKNNPNFNIFYSDTDSIYIDTPLNDKYVSQDELGKLKLENIFKNIVFLAPKVYGGVTLNGEEVIKVKGINHDVVERDISFDKLTTLLNKDTSLTFNQIKAFKNISEGSIKLLEQTYELIPTEYKRELVYDNNILVATKPYNITQESPKPH